jgi:tetratricopeptide (TPR) repeat protein
LRLRAAHGCSRSWLAIAVAVSALAAACRPEFSIDDLRSLQQAGRFAETIGPLGERLDEAPDDPELNHLYGVALLQTNQAALAIWPLRKSAQDPERAIDDGLLLARATLGGGSADDAVKVANRVLEIEPDHVDALRLLIAARVKARQQEEVLVDVERLLELKPGDSSALISRLVALLGLAREEEAKQTLAELGAALKDLDSGFEWEPRICGGTATFMKESGDPEAAEEVWNDCLEQFPTDESIVFAGVAFFDEVSDSARAIQILRRAYETAPTHLPRLAMTGHSEEAERILFTATEDGVNDRQAWFSLADYYERRGEPAKAAEAMANGLALMGQAPPLLVADYADLLIRAGEYDRVEALLPNFEGEPLITTQLRGRLLLVRGRSAEAIEALEEGLRLWPNNSVARLLFAQAYEQMGDYNRAVTEYAESLRSDADNRDALFPLLRLLSALSRGSEALTVLERYWRRNPNDPESLIQAIRIAGKSGNQDLIDRLARRLAEIPGYRAVSVAELAAIEASRAGPAAGIAQIRGAKLDLTQPINVPALRALIAYLVAAGKQREALRAADAALAANPDVSVFLELRAIALRATGEEALARETLERALALGPERASAIAELGSLAAARGERTAAIAFYDRATRVDPTDSNYAWEAIELVAASGDDAEVERRLEALLLRDRTHTQALSLRAEQLLTRNPERALSFARRVVRLLGTPESLELLGRVQLERGAPEPAAEALRRSVELQPNRASSHYWLGVALAAVGDVEGARSEFSTALETDSFPEREDAHARLALLNADS